MSERKSRSKEKLQLLSKEQKSRIKNTAEFDAAISNSYDVCDINIPIFGHLCDKLDYPDENIVWKIIGYFLLGTVIFIDVFLEMFTIISTIGAELLDGIPIVGSIWGTIEGLEIDDLFDMYSLVVVFVFCGPVAAIIPAVPEFAEGILEWVPWWTMSIAVWFFLVRPSRRRMMELKDRGIANDEFAWNDDKTQEKTDDELLVDAADLYGIKVKKVKEK